MALNNRQFNDYIYELQNEVDPETGCKHNSSYEQCRQTYFLKQQNQILQQPSSNSQEKTHQLESEISEMKQELETLQTQQTDSDTQTTSDNFLDGYTALMFAGLIVISIVATAIITKLIIKK